MANDPLGWDFAGVLDIDFALSVVSGRTRLAQAIMRRLTTRTGTLLDDESYGDDMRLLIGKSVDESEVEQRVAAQVLAEEGVEDAEVTVSLTGETLEIRIIVTDGEGPFPLVLEASELSLEALEIPE
ncbi:MAG: hypothetical protein R3337_00050 [Gammaproteobacteria bacterium]|nr:hypothetical protein [Gammaproteobacteria bacterium]